MAEVFAELPDDPQQLFHQVGRQLVESGDFHRLFDLRILQTRYVLGLPVQLHAPLDEHDDEVTAKLELAYLDACREVGQLLLEANRPVEAWRYLRPTGEKRAMRSWLARALPDEDNAEQLIELALHESLDPERGYAWLLAREGTCQAVTELEMMQHHLPIADQTACAAVLVRHLHSELLANVRGCLNEHQASDSTSPLSELIETHSDLLGQQPPIVDVSHLAATIRFARLLTEPTVLQLAIDLTNYGSLLSDDFVSPEPPPFESLYRTHRLMFRACQGHEIEAAMAYFGKRAKELPETADDVTAIEVYLTLLFRTGQTEQALEEYASLVSEDRALSDFAPSLLSLASTEQSWQKYFEICRSRNDILSFAAGKLAQQAKRD